MWWWDKTLTQKHKDEKMKAGLILGLLLSFAFMLTSCGFHLRGAYQLPFQMESTFIKSADENSELIRILKRTLKSNDINIVKTKKQAQAVLSVFNELQSKRVISVDTQGRAQEYELNYQISFDVTETGSSLLIKEQTIKLQRDFLFDAEDVLGKNREEATLVKDMQQDIVRLMMLRLQAVSKK